MDTKQNLIVCVKNAFIKKFPDQVQTFNDRIAASFETYAVRFAAFVGAEPSLVSRILAYIRMEEPEKFQTALYESVQSAVGFNKIDILLEILYAHPNVDLHFDNDILLRTACQNGCTDLVNFLLERGANPNIGYPNAIEAARDQEDILILLNKKY
jgi:hypothetical protein